MNRSFKCRNPPNENNSFKKWSFLKIDIQKCFDTIDIKDLISYIRELFTKKIGREKVFTMLRYCSIQFDIDKEQLRGRYDFYTLKHHFHEKGFLFGIADLIDLLEKEAAAKTTNFIKEDPNKTLNSNRCDRMDEIIVPLYVHDRNVTINKLDNLLKKCLEHVMIKIHGDIYERMNGILQGM